MSTQQTGARRRSRLAAALAALALTAAGSVPRSRGCRRRPSSPRTQTFGQAATPPLPARGARMGASTAFGQAATSPLAAGGRSTGASRAQAPSRSAHSFASRPGARTGEARQEPQRTSSGPVPGCAPAPPTSTSWRADWRCANCGRGTSSRQKDLNTAPQPSRRRGTIHWPSWTAGSPKLAVLVPRPPRWRSRPK
jgi:hypothetical protein